MKGAETNKGENAGDKRQFAAVLVFQGESRRKYCKGSLELFDGEILRPTKEMV